MSSKKLSKAKWTGSIFALITAIALGIMTAISIFLLFPAWGLPFIILIGFGTLLTESLVFWRAVRKVFNLLFGQDLWPSTSWRRITQRLEQDIALREFSKVPKKLAKIIEAKLAEQIDIFLQSDNSQPFKYHYILEAVELSPSCRDKKAIQAAVKKWCQEHHYSNELKLFNKPHRQEMIAELDNDKYQRHKQLCDTFKIKLFAGNKAIKKWIANYPANSSAQDVKTKSALLDALNGQLEIGKQTSTTGAKIVLGLFDDRYCKGITLQTEFTAKKKLLAVSLLFSILNGIGFSFVIFATFAEAFAAFGLSAAVVAGAPIWPLLVCTLFAVIAGISGAALLYKTLAEAVTDNIFKRIWKSIKKTCSSKPAWDKLNKKEKALHIMGCVLKLTGTVIVLSIGIFVTIATAGALLESSAATFAAFCHHSSAAVTLANTVVNCIIVWFAYLPADIMFGIDHSFSTIEKLGKIFTMLYEAVTDELNELYLNPKQRLRTYLDIMANFLCSPLKIVAAIICLIFSAAFVLHLIGSGAVNGQASSNPNDPFTHTMNKLADFLTRYLGINISAGGLAAGLTSIDECGQDADFVLPDSEEHEVGHEHGVSYNEIYRDLQGFSEAAQGYSSSAISKVAAAFTPLFKETGFRLLDETPVPVVVQMNL